MCFSVFDACSQEETIKELLRILKKDGLILLTGKNNEYFTVRYINYIKYHFNLPILLDDCGSYKQVCRCIKRHINDWNHIVENFKSLIASDLIILEHLRTRL